MMPESRSASADRLPATIPSSRLFSCRRVSIQSRSIRTASWGRSAMSPRWSEHSRPEAEPTLRPAALKPRN